MAAPFRIYNTLTRTVEDFVPVREGHVGVYVCGMTVYDRAHVGHARAFVVFDAFVRYLRFRGWDVTFVRNFTDVDDKIIARANERGEDPLELAARYIDAYHDDAAALGLVEPDAEPKVSESIDAIQAMIAALVAKGHAYASEGSVWYAVESFPGYGRLSGAKIDELQSPDASAGKRHPADFALWKAVKPGEPSWDSPWGPGRPGWHIECSAMSDSVLGHTLDIHGGGLDLVFPHHENEIAQSEGAHDATYANYWMHNGLLTMASGQKMGKSLGNVIDVVDALKEFPAEALRLYYLQSHYRSPLPWSPDALPEALGMVNRLYEAAEVAATLGGEEEADRVAADLGADAQAVLDLARSFEERFLAALADDFNTAQALGHLFELVRALNRFTMLKKARKRGGPIAREALRAFDLVKTSIGLLQVDVNTFIDEVKEKRLAAMGVERSEIEDLIARRATARAEKDWSTADTIRDELAARQIVVMDRPDGRADWRVQLGG